MTTNAVLGLSTFSLATTAKATELPPSVSSTPGGLYPMVSRAFEVDEYRIKRGWPVPVPPYDVHGDALISATGEVFTDREDPTALTTDAVVRWVADATLFDELALSWRPVQNLTGQQLAWRTSPTYSPVLIDNYEYRVNDERFYRDALNFDSDSRNHMWCDFTSVIAGASGYTVIMVLSPNSTYGNNLTVPYNGLWCPGGVTPLGETFTEDVGEYWMSVTTQGYYLYLETERGRDQVISIAPALNTSAPLMVAMVLGRPEAHFYAGAGPSSIRMKTVPSGPDSVPLSRSYVLGRSTGDVLHTADMALFEVGVYADRLTKAQVADQFSLLSQAYGGDQ